MKKILILLSFLLPFIALGQTVNVNVPYNFTKYIQTPLIKINGDSGTTNVWVRNYFSTHGGIIDTVNKIGTKYDDTKKINYSDTVSKVATQNFVLTHGSQAGYTANRYLSATSVTGGYNVLSPVIDVSPTTETISATNATVQGKKYLYSTAMGLTYIPPGEWGFSFYGNVSSASGTSYVHIRVFLYSAGGAETTLFTTTSPLITNTTDGRIIFTTSQNGFTSVLTDRLGFQISYTATGSAKTFSYIQGDGNASYYTNTLPLRHSQLRDLSWTTSSHTGTASSIASFDGSGNANYSTVNGLGFDKYHGFVQPTASTFGTFNNSTRTFTIEPNAGYPIWIQGVKHSISTTKTVQIGTGLGQHFIWYYLNAGVPTLATSQTSWSILDTTVIPVATVHWDGSTGIPADERHAWNRNLQAHLQAHTDWGAQYVSGFTTAPTFNTNNTFSFSGGVINDEDIYHTSAGTQTTCRVGYRVSGGASMTFDAIGTAYAKLNSGIPRYDNNGTLTDITNNNYGVYFIYATNRQESTKLVSIVGQGDYATISDAQNAPTPTLAGISVAEWKLLYKVIARRSGSTISSVTSQVLYNQNTGIVVSGGNASSMSAGNVIYVPTTPLSATNVQTAIDAIAPCLNGTGTIAGSKTAMSTDTINWSNGIIFTKTISGSQTLVFKNLLVGKTISYEVSGNYSLTLPSYCNKISGTYDGTKLNLIQFFCTNSTGGSEVVWYTINPKQ